ncbi:MAG: hypothetical protein WCH75_13070 [Candidatus Binatia bacterium]
MRTKKICRLTTTTVVVAFIFSFSASAWAQGFPRGLRDALGSRFKPGTQQPRREHRGLDAVRRWNAIAINASGLDHTPVANGETRIFGEQLGPARSSRAMAIVHIAIFDSVIAITGGYRSYTGIAPAGKDTSMNAAIAQAAHDTLMAVFPSQTPQFNSDLAEDLKSIPEGRAKNNGIELGRRAAAAILALRQNDGSEHAEPLVGVDYITKDDPGKWRQDPISQIPLALGAYWSKVRPFVMKSVRQFRVPAPPALTSRQYAAAFDEAKELGGDGIVTPTVRTEEQTSIGTFWAYDGTPSLCAPPRMYNQLTTQVCRPNGVERSGACASPGASKRGNGGCGHRDLGIQI